MTGMSMGFSMRQEITIRQEHRIDFPEEIARINTYFERTAEKRGPNKLKELLRIIPQKQYGKFVYVVAGGWAVEILTGKARAHNNINVLVLDPAKDELSSNRCLDYLGVEYMEHAIKRALVKKDIVKAVWKRGKREVYVPSREFMIGTKLLPKSVTIGNRTKDLEDVLSLVQAEPDTGKLAKVLNAFPYVRDGQTIADFVDKTGQAYRHLRKKALARSRLETVSSVLQKQLQDYQGRQKAI